MTDENLSHVQEPVDPAIEDEAITSGAAEPGDPAIEGDDGIDSDIDGEEDLDELDFGFKKYRVPKDLKENVERLRLDATRKTETASRTKKEAEALLERAQAARQASEEELGIRANLHHINSELKRLEGFGWTEYQQARQEDPLGADEAWHYKTHLREQKADSERQISEKQNERTRGAQQEIAKRLEATIEFARKIPGITQEIHAEVLSLAESKGVPTDRLAEVIDPTVYDILYHARLGYHLAAKRAAPKPVSQEPPPQVETVRTRRNPPPAGLSDRLSTDEWIKRRNAELEKR